MGIPKINILLIMIIYFGILFFASISNHYDNIECFFVCVIFDYSKRKKSVT